jgi:hypothetical protein
MRPRPAALLLALAAAAAADPGIRGDALLEHVKRLSSDELEGRGSGTPGEEKATCYVAERFQALGLLPMGEGGTFFQDVAMPGESQPGPGSRFEVEGRDVALAPGSDFLPLAASAAAAAEGDLFFAGYGVRAPDLGYDDYAGADVAGKVVVVFRHLPHGGPWEGPGPRRAHAPFAAKLKVAEELGAVAIVVVNDPYHFGGAGGPSRSDGLQRGDIGAAPGRVPFLHLTLAAAERLFEAAFGAAPRELEAAIHEGDVRPRSRQGSVRARVVADIAHRTLHGRNVCALLPAGAKDAVDEIVVVGGHHDHLGRGAAGSLARSAEERSAIHNGADDNASGTAGVLEAARYLAERRDTLRRPVLFLTFTGEERGLLGSRHWVEHPTVPLDRIAAMLNMDMIGRLGGRDLFVGGVKTSPAFGPLVERLGADVGLPIVAGDGGRAPSDNTSFYARGIPVLFFFTGLHADYHRPGDDWEKLDVEAMGKVALLAARTAEEVARLPRRPEFRRADQGGFGPPRAILGITVGEATQGGVGVAGVVPDGPAARAGIRPGDVVTAVAGEATPDFAALAGALGKWKIGDSVAVDLLREGKALAVEVVLARG